MEANITPVNHQEIDVVIPLYNEGQSISEFHRRLMNVLDTLAYPIRVIYVDDGSVDETTACLFNIVQNDQRITSIQLSRNFGHQAALTAGLDSANGDLVITMDGDGQHPPEMIPILIDRYKEGYDIVQTQRVDDNRTSLFKRITAKMFYRLINKISNTQIIPGTADFRLMTHQVVMALREMKEYHRFFRGMVPWLGYKVSLIPYSPQMRIAGKSKYTLKKMLKLSEDAVFSFSLIPIRIGLTIGVFFILLAILEAIYVLSFWISGNQDSLAPGWSSIVFLILITGGSIMIMMSILGIYIGQIHQEIKQRPIYIIRSIFSHK